MLKNKYFKVIISTILAFAMVICSNIIAFAADNTSSARSVDSMLLKSQQWLKSTYSSNSAFGSVPEDGTSRRATVNACIRALQIELGITATADNFGQGTQSRFKSQYPNGVVQQEYPSTEESNVYGIIQCALWTKGYSTGASSITKHFYDGTGGAIIDLKEDMGFNSPNSTVTLNVMKGLLSMDQYVKVSDGDDSIRLVQQSLNREYEDYVGIIPCDGLYGRQMNKALIKVLQAIEGYSVENATGNFGEGTKANLPLNLDNSPSWSGQYETYKKCIKLVQYCLCCNGYGDSINLSNVQWNTSLSNVVKNFQADLNIEQTGTMNVDTWMALLLSKGNPDRSCTACDTRFEMTQERLDYLKSNGYTVVGRYLTGSSKGLKDEEPKRILDNGFSFFPIFQETLYTDTVSKYNYNLGVSDANKAVNRAEELGIPSGTIIYFAIDFDPIDSEISSYVIPYFNGINSAIGKYKVGIYGTRNACTKVMGAGYAETCFVSDMSTGYSGNMGFKIPNNWNLDQFHEYSVTTASGSWDIDKVSYSGSFPVVTGLTYYKLGNFVLTGSHDGLEFPPYTGAKRLRYTISWTSEEPMNSLYVYFNKRAYHSDGTYSWKNESTLYLDYSNEYQRTITSNWIDVSDKIGYRFSYKCMDKSKPIGDPPSIGEEVNRDFEDGTCNVSVYIELEY